MRFLYISITIFFIIIIGFSLFFVKESIAISPEPETIEPWPEIDIYILPPSKFDWRDHNGNWMTPVKNQGSCGSCSIFAFIGVMEAVYKIENNNPNIDINLSEESAVSYFHYGCCPAGSGAFRIFLNFFKDHGVVSEDCFPYQSGTCSCIKECSNCKYPDKCSNTKCTPEYLCDNWEDEVYSVRKIERVPYYWDNPNYISKISDIKYSLKNAGPLFASIRMRGAYDKETGIYECKPEEKGKPTNHAVVLVGYNDDEEYWIFKNSWGEGWLDKGYFKVNYDNNCNVGEFRIIEGIIKKPYSLLAPGHKFQISDDKGIDPFVRDNRIIWGDNRLYANYGTTFAESIWGLEVPEIVDSDYVPEPLKIVREDPGFAYQGPSICGDKVYFSTGQAIYYNILGKGTRWKEPICTEEMMEECIEEESDLPPPGGEEGVVKKCKCSKGSGFQIYPICCDIKIANKIAWIDGRPIIENDGSIHFDRESIMTMNLPDGWEGLVNRGSPEHDITGAFSVEKSHPEVDDNCSILVWSEYNHKGRRIWYHDGTEDSPKFIGFDEDPEEVGEIVQMRPSVSYRDDFTAIAWIERIMKEGQYAYNLKYRLLRDRYDSGSTFREKQGTQSQPITSRRNLVYFDARFNSLGTEDIILYTPARTYFITDPKETEEINASRSDLAFDGDIVVWNETSKLTGYKPKLYMFKINTDYIRDW